MTQVLKRRRGEGLMMLIGGFFVGAMVLTLVVPLYLAGPRGYDSSTWSTVMAVVGFCPAVGVIVIAWYRPRDPALKLP